MIIFKNNTALSRIILAFFSQGLIVFVTIISLPFLITLFGIKDYAIFGLFLTFQALSSIIEGGASINVIKVVANNQLDTNIDNSVLVYKKIFYLSLILSFLVSFLVFYNWNYSISKIFEYSLIISGSLSLRLLTNFYKSISLGFNKHNYVNIFSVFFYFLRFVVPIIFGFSITFFLFFQLILIIIEFVYFNKISPLKIRLDFLFNFNVRRVKTDKHQEENVFMKNIIILTVLSVLITNIDKTLLSLFGSQEDFGGFQAVSNLSGGLLVLLGPLNAVYQPLLSANKNEKDYFFKLFSTYWLLLIVGFGFVTIVLQVFSEQILKFWLGNEFKIQLLELFNFHIVFTFGISLMSFGYMYCLINNKFTFYLKYFTVFTLIIVVLFTILIANNYFYYSIFLGALISLIFSFFIMIKYGKEILVFFMKKTYFILVFTYFFIFLFLLFYLLEIKNDIIYYSSLLYFILLVSNIRLMKFIFSTLKFNN
jgi:O-antigen/teichoic acid export membrane protein